MIKKIVFILATVCTLLLIGCSKGGGRIFVTFSEEKLADKRMEQILVAIKTQDKEGLKALFSMEVLDEAKDLDSAIDYLYDFFEGNVESCERHKWSSGESKSSGEKTLEIRSYYNVSTDKENYIFFVLDYAINTINPENEGLYTLRVIKSEDKETEFPRYWQTMAIPGIYQPKEIDINKNSGTSQDEMTGFRQ